MKKFIEDFSVRERIVYEWVASNRYRLVSVILISIIVLSLSFLPYVNLYLTQDIIPMFIIFLISFIFRINTKNIILIGVLSFLPVMFLEVLGRHELAEYFSNYIYAILISGVLKGIIFWH